MSVVEHQQQSLWAMHGTVAERARERGASLVVKKCIPSPSGRGPGRRGKFGSQKVHPLSLRERARERGYD